MPILQFRNTQTGEIIEENVKISEYDDYKSMNPHLERYFDSVPNIIGGVTKESGSLPDGFKDKLKEMKARHPLSSGVDHLI